MATGIWAAASGATAQSAALDTVANNIANASTPGYRASRALFEQRLADAMDGSPGTTSQRLAVVRTEEPDFSLGSFVQTGRPLDVALAEPHAFLVVATEQGERYTRAGALTVATDGTLTTRDGLPVLNAAHRPIRVDAGTSDIRISRTGEVVADGAVTGQLWSVTFDRMTALEKQGDALFAARPEAGPPRSIDTAFEGETLELSNAHAVQSMTGLVSITRQFDMLARVIEAFSQVESAAARDIMK